MSKESKSLVKDEQITGMKQDDQYKRWITDVSRRFIVMDIINNTMYNASFL